MHHQWNDIKFRDYAKYISIMILIKMTGNIIVEKKLLIMH